MGNVFWLDDDAWAAIELHLPTNQPGARRVDDRRIISGIIHVLKSGCRWRDCPPDDGPPTPVYNRFNRWSRRGHGRRILKALAEIDTCRHVLADKGYECDAPRTAICDKGATPVISGRRSRKHQISFDKRRDLAGR